jgi:hypothetical protein
MNTAQIELNADRTTTPGVPKSLGHIQTRSSGSGADLAVGIAITVLVPTVFWTASIWGICRLADVELSAAAITLIGGSMLVFLSMIGSALLSRN